MAINKTSINDVMDKNYAEFDLGLLCEASYTKLKPIDMVAYTLLNNQHGLSVKTTLDGSKRYVDKNGYIFVSIGQDKLCKVLRTTRPTLIASLKRLEEAELIQVINVGNMKCNRIYVGRLKRTITLGDYMKNMNISEDEEVEINIDTVNIDKIKTPTSAKVEATKKTISNKSICNNKDNNTPNKEKKEVNIVNENNEVVKLLKNSFLSIKKSDYEKAIATFTDIEKLKQAIKTTQENGNFGIDALGRSYLNIGNSNKYKTKAHNFNTQGTKGYTEEQLLQMNKARHSERIEVTNNFAQNNQ